MPKMRISSYDGRPLFDIASYAKRGPARRVRLSPAELAQVSRTVSRAPEVVVKILPKGSHDLRSIERHFGYIGRYGELSLETDDGQSATGREVGRHLVEDWDLDLDESRRGGVLVPAGWRRPPRHVHKLMLSMPPGTPPAALLAAARHFLREEFALKHRYAFVLHTDEPHPHVHAVVKAVSEEGVRLNISKAILREWRSEFARHLREHGIDANATDRSVRGQIRSTRYDGMYRAQLRGESTHFRDLVSTVAAELAHGQLVAETGKARLGRTRRMVTEGWGAICDILRRSDQPHLASLVDRFVGSMSPVQTDKEWIAAALVQHSRIHRDRGKSRSPEQRQL